LYSQASITKYSLLEKYAFLSLNSFRIVQITAFVQTSEFLSVIAVSELVVDFQ
jgi:hypothetical protein